MTDRQVILVTERNVDSRLRIFRFGRLVDSFAVVTQRYLVVIDTMVNLETSGEIMNLLRPDLISERSLLIVNTHGDWDHCLGNGLFVAPTAPYPAPVIAHRIAAERIMSPEAAEGLAKLKAESPGEFDTAENWSPTVLFDGTLTIDGGDLTLVLIPTPGHQPDHISIWIPEIRVLLAGDAAELPIPYVPEWKTLPELRASLHRMNDLKADQVLYSHAQDITDPALIGHNIRYFDELEARCRRALANESIPPEIDALADPAAAIGWQFEDALPPVMALDDLPWPEGHSLAIKAMLKWVRESHP
jgi:glyoxylase-like metal-dependent hydrolase (beta-lactamase superfamily II)